MTAIELYQEALRLGLRLEQRGDKLAVIPARLCPPAFADVLRQYKAELLAWLAAPEETLAVGKYPAGSFDAAVKTLPKAEQVHHDPVPRKTAEEAAWVHIAKQILAGEFQGADSSTRKSLSIGLRSIKHPDCQRALERLGGETMNQ